MSRNTLLALILLAAALILGALSFVLQRGASPAPLVAPNYADSAHWSYRPVNPTAAVWDQGWDVDVFAVLPSSARALAAPAKAERMAQSARTEASALAEDLSKFGTLYAPAYRSGDRADDLVAAFQHYIDHDNRGRAFVIALSDPADIAALSAARDDKLVRGRFGGFLVFDPKSDTLQPVQGTSVSVVFCPSVQLAQGDCLRTLPARSKSGQLNVDADESGLMTWRAAWLAELETGGDQLAAPIGEEEVIAPSEIRSPGDTGEPAKPPN